jgi:hypothetical protein
MRGPISNSGQSKMAIAAAERGRVDQPDYLSKVPWVRADSKVRWLRADGAAFFFSHGPRLCGPLPDHALAAAQRIHAAPDCHSTRSGLGLEAQAEAIRRFADAEGYVIASTFEEHESGKGSDALDRRMAQACLKMVPASPAKC